MSQSILSTHRSGGRDDGALSGMSTRSRLRAERAKQAGFTLVELLVSLAAGLAVVMSVVALGRDATTNFHQEMRVASAQMTQRLAAQRMRSDFERAGFMGTGNMWNDPMVSRGLADGFGAAPGYTTAAAQPAYLSTMVSVRLNVGGSTIGAAHSDVNNYSILADNALSPDQIELTGNFSTADEYSGAVDQPAGACSAQNGARIYLETKDPAVLRLMYAPDGTYSLAAAINATQNVFSPAFNTTTGKAYPFGMRVWDFSMSHYQFAALCTAVGSIGIDMTTGLPRPYVDTAAALMTQDQGAGGVVPGQGAGSGVVVNPVQTVRWEIVRRAALAGAATSAAGTLLDGPVEALSTARFELVRSWVPFDVKPFADVTATCDTCVELVGEFAVDLKVAFSVLATPTTFTDYVLDDTTMPVSVADPDPANMGTTTPQKIRMIRFRLGTRTAMVDRPVTIPYPTVTAPVVALNFLFRYEVAPNQYARVRETMEEVFTPNQVGMNY